MITYPALVAAVDSHDLDELAATSGLPATIITAIAAGGRAPSLAIRERLARALHVDTADLFRAVSNPGDIDLEPALAGAPTRYVTDAATLRIIDR